MSLIRFPNQMRVTLWTGFKGGGNGLNEDQVLSLIKVSGQNIWTESGEIIGSNNYRVSYRNN